MRSCSGPTLRENELNMSNDTKAVRSWRLVRGHQTYLECSKCKRKFWTSYLRDAASRDPDDGFKLHRMEHVESHKSDDCEIRFGGCCKGENCNRPILLRMDVLQSEMSEDEYHNLWSTVAAAIRLKQIRHYTPPGENSNYWTREDSDSEIQLFFNLDCPKIWQEVWYNWRSAEVPSEVKVLEIISPKRLTD